MYVIHTNPWSEGYAAFTYSFKDKATVINYIKNQQEHHKHESSKDELMRLFNESGISWDERYFIQPLRG